MALNVRRFSSTPERQRRIYPRGSKERLVLNAHFGTIWEMALQRCTIKGIRKCNSQLTIYILAGGAMRPREAYSAPPLANRPWWLRQWWLNRPLSAKGLIVVAVPLFALIGTTSASLALTHDESQERSVALAGRNLSAAAGLVLANAVNAETGVRGYGMTDDPLFLSPYKLALMRIGAERTYLRDAAVTEGDSGQQRVVDATTGKVFAELAQLRSATAAGMSGRSLRPAVENEKRTMDLLRRQAGSLASAPTALEAPRSNQIARLQKTITILDVAALLLGLLAGLAGVALFTSGIARRVAANAANADRLGEGQSLIPRHRAGA